MNNNDNIERLSMLMSCILTLKRVLEDKRLEKHPYIRLHIWKEMCSISRANGADESIIDKLMSKDILKDVVNNKDRVMKFISSIISVLDNDYGNIMTKTELMAKMCMGEHIIDVDLTSEGENK